MAQQKGMKRAVKVLKRKQQKRATLALKNAKCQEHDHANCQGHDHAQEHKAEKQK